VTKVSPFGHRRGTNFDAHVSMAGAFCSAHCFDEHHPKRRGEAADVAANRHDDSPTDRADANWRRPISSGRMTATVRALQVQSLDGPDAVALVDVPAPGPRHPVTGEQGVVIDVHAAGVSFPDLLMSRGEYQMRLEPPFVGGGEVAGTVRSAPEGSGFSPGDRVAAMSLAHGFADVAVAPPLMTFGLADALDFAQGAALVLNYHTAWFCLAWRGQLREGETVLVHGAAGGVGTACLQVAKGLGARTIAVVSTGEKERVAREAGADEVVRTDGFKDAAKELTGGRGVDMVLDPVGGDRFTDSLRSLGRGGRLVVVGFTGGSIPEVKVNRLLLNNLSVVGAGWGAWAFTDAELTRRIAREVDALVDSGHVRPIVGVRMPLEQGADALRVLDERGALGKVVLDVR
jgi:NADPH2:quinone reductase